MNKIKSFCHKISWPFRFYARAFTRLELMNRAAGLSFYTMISIFPLIIVMILFANYFFPTELLEQSVNAILKDSFPHESEIIISNIKSLFHRKMGLSFFGIIALFLGAQLLYNNLEKTMNRILHAPRHRNIVLTRLFFLLWLAGMILVIFSPLFFELIAYVSDYFGFTIPYFKKISGKTSFFLSGILMFVWITVLIPTKRLRFKRVLLGGILFSASLQFGKWLFHTYVLENINRYNVFYGSLSSTMIVMIWIFYFYNMFLFFVYWVGRHRDPVFHGETL